MIGGGRRWACLYGAITARSRSRSCRAMLGDGVPGWVHTREGDNGLQFCSWRCLAEYATARVLVEGATDGGP